MPTPRAAFAVIAVLALAAAARAQEPQDDDAPPTITATLARDAAGAWTARFDLESPARALVFPRSRGDYRASTWTPLDPGVTPGLTIERRGDYDVIAADAPFASVAFAVVPRTTRIEKEYTPFVPFTDGGVAIHDGQLDVLPLADPADAETLADQMANYDGPGARMRFRLEDAAGGTILVHGAVFDGVAEWPKDGGVYVYLGDAAPLETDALAAIIDPGAPAWIRAQMLDLLPRLFAGYADRFGARDTRPGVLLAYQGAEHDGYSLKGGALADQNQIVMAISGAAITEESPKSAAMMASLFAHEAAHLWNMNGVRQASSGVAWLHEGGADLLAWRALARLGELSEAQVDGLVRGRAVLCASGLEESSLADAVSGGNFALAYGCGVVLSRLIDAADPQDFDAFTAAFLDHVRAKAEPAYDVDDVLAVMEARGANAASRAWVARIATARLDDPERDLRAALASAGVFLPHLDDDES